MKYRNKNARVLSPKQVRAVALRAQGMSVAAIAREIGQHRVTVSRWFNQDELVIAELAGSVEDMYDEEVRRHVGIRHKAMGVVESALDAGDVRTALAVLRLSPPPPPSVAADPGWMDGLPVSGVVDPGDVSVVSPRGWQLALSRAEGLLRSAGEVADQDQVLDRILLLDDIALTTLAALELGEGEGLRAFTNLAVAEQNDHLAEARTSLQEAFELVAGPSDEEEGAEPGPLWPGDNQADAAIELLATALKEMLDGVHGAIGVLVSTAGPGGARMAESVGRAGQIAAALSRGATRKPSPVRAERLAQLTQGFAELVGAMTAAAALDVVEADPVAEGKREKSLNP